MDDIARSLQRDILGPGRLVVPCGCIICVDGFFPKKPWVHKEQQQHFCVGTCRNAYGEHALGGWINKLTFTNVSKEEFDEAWLSAKKVPGALFGSTNHDVVSVTAIPVVRMNRYEGVAQNGRTISTLTHTTHLVVELEWPPKMVEVFKGK